MDQIGRYRILDELGRGATGIVYRAQDPAIGRVIAIKTIRLSDFTDEAERDRLRERLFREAQSAGILSHPNIVTIYDIAEESGLAYIFMEYVDGPPLERLLNAPEALDRERVLSIFRQTATALDYAHKKGIVHRDIKPANILIHEGNVAKITDFGVAKILSQQMTQSGVMMGTPNYMSPEQVQGHAVDGHADQFALAVIAYEILTGEKPFVADHLPSLLYRIVREDPVPPQRLNPTLGPQVEMVLRKALAKGANDRYQNCAEFIEALAAACALNPNWRPLPRSSAQTLPTVGAGAAIDHTSARPAVPPPRPSAPAPPQPQPQQARPVVREEVESGNPLLKSLVWMLVGIGLVGLVLFGAQKFLFNRNSEPAVTQDQATDQPAAQPAQQPPQPSRRAEPPPSQKPSPVGEKRDGDETAKSKPADNSPDSTTPETSKSEAVKPVAAAPKDTDTLPLEPPQQRPARSYTPPPVIASKSGAEQTIQVITDPPGAKVTIDDTSSLSCRAPCMLKLSPGRHFLNADLSGYRGYPRVFNVPQDGDIFLSLSKIVSTLSVASNPAGATIEINGKPQSNATPSTFTLPPGTYHVRVSRAGSSLDFDVQLRDGDFIRKTVNF